MFSKQTKEVTFSITDDSGFLALINANRYHSFIGHDWTLDQLKNRFREQEAEQNLIIWPTGEENVYKVVIVNQLSQIQPFKEFRGTIRVTNETLYLTNYEDITMAAQFEDEILPAKHNADLRINLDNGIYEVSVNQMSDPDKIKKTIDDPDFEIMFIWKTN